MTPRWRAVVPFVLLLAAACGAAAEPRDRHAELRAEFLALLNQERRARGAAELRLDPALSAFADDRAARASAAPTLEGGGLGAEETLARLAARGYAARRVAQTLVQKDGPPPAVVAYWRGAPDSAFAEALGTEMRDLGVGVAVPVAAPPIYAFVIALSEADDFRAQSAGLADRDAVRAALLREVNEVRRAHRRAPLAIDRSLDRAAQSYAELLLAAGYSGHVGPDGSTPLERAQAAGYAVRAVGENLARGPFSAAEVVAAWMDSEHHRANLLRRDFRHVGHGLAAGRGPDGWQTVWVQMFGRAAF